MSNGSKHETAKSASTPNWPFGFPGGDFAQPFGGYVESCAKKMTDWNGEISRFLNGRISRNGEMFRAITQCDSLPKVMEVETAWFRTAVEDYLNESKRLIKLNSEIME